MVLLVINPWVPPNSSATTAIPILSNCILSNKLTKGIKGETIITLRVMDFK